MVEVNSASRLMEEQSLGASAQRHQQSLLAAPLVKRLGQVPYQQSWAAMQSFTAARTATTPDELWLLEHPPIYTYGLAGRAEHLPPSDARIPLLKVDRGGQVTYHGPGQLIVYALLDLRRRRLGARELVRRLEGAVVDLLASHGVVALSREGAPGVYVGGAKIAALGLRMRNGCCYHGLSLNVDMDLTPFALIDPCGFPGLAVTQTKALGITSNAQQLGEELLQLLCTRLEAN